MARYKVVLADKLGSLHARFVNAVSREAAARTAVEITGWKLISVEEPPPPEPAKTESAPAPAPPIEETLSSLFPPRSTTLSDFFAFRTLISPRLVRISFVLVTALCVLMILAAPLQYIGEYRSKNAERDRALRSLEDRLQLIDRALAETAPLSRTLSEQEAIRDQFMNRPGFQISLREAQQKVAQIQRDVRRIAEPFGATTHAELEAEASRARNEHRNLPPPSFPSPLPALATALGAVLLWIGIRLALELAYALVFMHEQLGQIRDHLTRS